MEEKKCRLCGYADQKNVNMFNAPNKGLVSKIRSVFPILLYENDPLPKYICKKCTATVSFMFLDIQRVMKMQQKWISSLRCNQPNNNYICILDMIESAHHSTKQSIKTILHEDVPSESIERISLSFPTTDDQSKKKYLTLTPKPAPKEETAHTESHVSKKLNFPVQIKVEINENVPNKLISCSDKLDLQKNGCVQKKSEIIPCQTKRAAAVAAAVACTSQLLESEPKTKKFDHWTQIKKCSTSSISPKAKRHKQQSIISTNLTFNIATSPCKVKQHLLKAPTNQGTGIKCPLCSLNFKSTIELAAHQVLHLRLQLPKIFVRKCLPKNERRGRLINRNDKQYIRCLNCWRLFENNKTILSHWSQNDCGFYCQICGKEFANAPKMLREHVPAAHGVSYRSTKFQYAKFGPPLTELKNQNKFENNTDFLTTLKSKEYKQEEMRLRKVKKSHPQKRAACSICNLLFHNMMARNSHMRKHKKTLINSIEVKEEPQEEMIVQQKHKISKISESSESECAKTSFRTQADLPFKSIKTEPLEIEDITAKCQVCNNILTDSLDQHACF